MRKLISWIALAGLLFVVPLVSWLYLKKGLEYRKNILKEVAVKDSVSVNEDSLHILRGKTTVLVLATGSKHSEIVEGIRLQYEDVPRFQIWQSGESSSDGKIPADYCSSLVAKYPEDVFMLIDTSLRIRNTYGASADEVKKLIEHIAVVLPRKEEADIKMKKQ